MRGPAVRLAFPISEIVVIFPQDFDTSISGPAIHHDVFEIGIILIPYASQGPFEILSLVERRSDDRYPRKLAVAIFWPGTARHRNRNIFGILRIGRTWKAVRVARDLGKLELSRLIRILQITCRVVAQELTVIMV